MPERSGLCGALALYNVPQLLRGLVWHHRLWSVLLLISLIKPTDNIARMQEENQHTANDFPIELSAALLER